MRKRQEKHLVILLTCSEGKCLLIVANYVMNACGCLNAGRSPYVILQCMPVHLSGRDILFNKMREDGGDVEGKLGRWLAPVFHTPFDARLCQLAKLQELKDLGNICIGDARACLGESSQFHRKASVSAH
jgi:hypothetical protein